MSNDSRVRLVRIASIGGLVVVAVLLAIGAAIVGAPQTVAADDAGEYLLAFYEEGNVEGFVEALAPGSVDPAELPAVEQQLQLLLRPGVEIVESSQHTIQGKTVTRLSTSDLLQWCVDEDGAVFLRCKLGEAPVELSTGDVPVETVAAQLDAFVDGAHLVVALEATGQGVALGLPELTTADGAEVDAALIQSALSVGGRLVPLDADRPVLESGIPWLMIFEGDADALADRSLTLTWGENSVAVDTGRIEWLL